jgi:hypothetical protein
LLDALVCRVGKVKLNPTTAVEAAITLGDMVLLSVNTPTLIMGVDAHQVSHLSSINASACGQLRWRGLLAPGA